MSGYSWAPLAWIVLLIVSWPYVERARYHDMSQVAAYLMFVTTFSTLAAILFGMVTTVAASLGRARMLDHPVGILLFLVAGFAARIAARPLADRATAAADAAAGRVAPVGPGGEPAASARPACRSLTSRRYSRPRAIGSASRRIAPGCSVTRSRPPSGSGRSRPRSECQADRPAQQHRPPPQHPTRSRGPRPEHRPAHQARRRSGARPDAARARRGRIGSARSAAGRGLAARPPGDQSSDVPSPWPADRQSAQVGKLRLCCMANVPDLTLEVYVLVLFSARRITMSHEKGSTAVGRGALRSKRFRTGSAALRRCR